MYCKLVTGIVAIWLAAINPILPRPLAHKWSFRRYRTAVWHSPDAAARSSSKCCSCNDISYTGTCCTRMGVLWRTPLLCIPPRTTACARHALAALATEYITPALPPPYCAVLIFLSHVGSPQGRHLLGLRSVHPIIPAPVAQPPTLQKTVVLHLIHVAWVMVS